LIIKIKFQITLEDKKSLSDLLKINPKKIKNFLEIVKSEFYCYSKQIKDVESLQKMV